MEIKARDFSRMNTATDTSSLILSDLPAILESNPLGHPN